MRKVLLAAAVMTACSQAESQPTTLPPPPIGDMIIGSRFIEQVIAHVAARLRSLSSDGTSISEQDLLDERALEQAQRRASEVSQILTNDIDGDGVVTRGEAERVAMRRGWRRDDDRDDGGQRAVDNVMKADGNGDGRIEITEMIAYANAKGGDRAYSREEPISGLLSAEPSGDKRLTLAEAETLVRQAFAVIDTNSDGRIGNDEAQAYRAATEPQRRAQREAQQAERTARNCSWPGLPKGAIVSAVAAYDGAGLSNIALNGQDRSTAAATIVIERGETPFFLLITSSQSVVWSLEGAVDRLLGVAIATRESGQASGVTGVDKQKVQFLAPGSCVPSPTGDWNDARVKRALDRMLKQAGATTAQVTAAYEVYEASVPRGVALAAPPAGIARPAGADERIWRELVRFSPGGVAEFDPAAVVSTGKVERYDVMPQEAGLLQLAREGVLARGKEGFPQTYDVLKPMRRYPAELAGSHLVVFVQPADFPLPAGDISHSCLHSRETGALLAGNSVCDELGGNKKIITTPEGDVIIP